MPMAPKPMEDTVGPEVPSVREFMIMLDSMRLVIAPVKRHLAVTSPPSGVAVADELNFTRAAERLHLGQQAVSKSVGQLEANSASRCSSARRARCGSRRR